VKVHLVDGTYELFRHYYGRPPHRTAGGEEVAAVRGVLGTLLALVEGGATHIGVATDHVIESFRNELWPGYKSSQGVPADLLSQFGLLEEAIDSLGMVVWPMVDLEADDALASAAAVAASEAAVDQVIICTPDKDLGQCVRGSRVVQLDRRRGGEAGGGVVDEAAVRSRYGIGPTSIPDWLALVGDSSDGFPGLAGWGPKSASAVLARYGHLEAIPDAPGQWEVTVRGAAALAATLAAGRDQALLFRELATLRVDRTLLTGVGELEWKGPARGFGAMSGRLEAPGLARRAEQAAALAGGAR